MRKEFDPRSVDNHLDAESLRLNLKRAEHVFPIGTSAGDRELVSSSIRPGLRAFLLALSAQFEPVLFTSALPIYASPLLDLVEGKSPNEPSSVEGDQQIPAELHPIFRHRIYRAATVPAVEMDYGYVKDIRLIGRDMRRTILVDNSVHACMHSPDNCVIVPDYLGAKEDAVLKPLLALLEEAAQYEDVRPFLRAKLRFREQMEKQGFTFPGMPREGEDIALPSATAHAPDAKDAEKKKSS